MLNASVYRLKLPRSESEKFGDASQLQVNHSVTQSTVGTIKCETDKSSVDNDEQLHVLPLYKATSVSQSDLQGLELNKKYDTTELGSSPKQPEVSHAEQSDMSTRGRIWDAGIPLSRFIFYQLPRAVSFILFQIIWKCSLYFRNVTNDSLFVAFDKTPRPFEIILRDKVIEAEIFKFVTFWPVYVVVHGT